MICCFVVVQVWDYEAGDLAHVNMVRFCNRNGQSLADDANVREALRRCFFSGFPRKKILEGGRVFLVVPFSSKLLQLRSELQQNEGRLFVGFDSENGNEKQGGFVHESVSVRVVSDFGSASDAAAGLLNVYVNRNGGPKNAHGQLMRRFSCVLVFDCKRRCG